MKELRDQNHLIFENNQKLSTVVQQLKAKIDELDQKSLENAIEIVGVPIIQNEDCKSVVKICKNNVDFEHYNLYKTRGIRNGNLELFKPNTSLMGNYYINRGIKLFNQLPLNIKLIDNDIKFKVIIKKLYTYATFSKSLLISVFIFLLVTLY